MASISWPSSSVSISSVTVTNLPATLGQKTMAGSLSVAIASDQSAVPVSGTVTATNPSVGATGAAVPASATFLGGKNGANLIGLSLDASGNLAALPLPTGAAAAAQLPATLGQKVMASSLAVVIASDQSAIPITGTITASNPSVGTIGSTAPTSGTYIAGINGGNLKGLALDASGNLAALPLPTGASTSALQTTISGQLPATLGQKAMAASLAVVVASDQSTLPVVPVDIKPATQNVTVIDSGSTSSAGFNNQSIISGTPTANSAASFAVASYESLALEVTGTWTGTLTFEVSIDGGTTWTPHAVHQFGSPNFVTAVTANFIASLNMAGKTNFRARATAAMTGTATVRVVLSTNPSTIYVANSIKLIDSTAAASPPGATIKPASTAPLSTDTSLVVALNPNSSVQVKDAVNSNGSNTDSTVSTVATLTAPANTVGFILMCLDTSTDNIRWRIGATATASSGQQLQPGRDTGYVPCAANISICAQSGTQNYNIQWVLSS